MNEKKSRASKKLGLMPGTVLYVGRERTEQVHIDVIDYSETELQEHRYEKPEDCSRYKESKTITWINVDGIHDAKLVETIGTHFGIHPLQLEDIVNTGQRATIEDAKSYIFIVLKMLHRDPKSDELQAEQVCVAFGERWVITFQETREDVFDFVRKRLKAQVPRTRFMTADYLAYAIVDAVVDYYFVELERLGDEIEVLDDAVSEGPKPEHLHKIRDLKKQLIFMRKAVWPLREVIAGMQRYESKLIQESTQPYLRDLYEHIIQVIDTVETFRDTVGGLLDLYHTGISNRMNEIMKVLTIFASIFIPLGFLAGVYGMNFNTETSPFNLPELTFRYGYIMFWAAVLMIGGGLLFYFRRKKWL